MLRYTQLPVNPKRHPQGSHIFLRWSSKIVQLSQQLHRRVQHVGNKNSLLDKSFQWKTSIC